MFSWNIIALRGGDIVAQLVMVVALLALPLGDRVALLLVCSGALLLVRGGALLLIGGGALPSGDGLALPVGHRLAILVEHLAAGPGRHRVADSVVLGGALTVEILVALLLHEDGTLPL